MKVILLNNPYEIVLIPRVFPQITDNLSLNLRNEMTNEVLNPDFIFQITDKLTILIDESIDFKLQQKFEIELINNLEVIYRGKLLILEENTNIQAYQYGSQSNSKFQFK